MGFGVRTTGRISAMFCLLFLLTVSTPAQAQQQFTEIEVDLWSTSKVFNRDHRIRVAVAGTNWDRFERNTNDGGDLDDPNYVVAYPEILFGPDHPSSVELPISIDRFAPAPRRATGRLTP